MYNFLSLVFKQMKGLEKEINVLEAVSKGIKNYCNANNNSVMLQISITNFSDEGNIKTEFGAGGMFNVTPKQCIDALVLNIYGTIGLITEDLIKQKFGTNPTKEEIEIMANKLEQKLLEKMAQIPFASVVSQAYFNN